jgi:DeoR family transcriptional regulator, galactitol utilization operon repressor
MLSLSDRERRILELLGERQDMSVSDMSRALGVSTVTVRNDLSSLESKGLAVRNHGGATTAYRPGILDRQRSRVKEKLAIARDAAKLIDDGDSVAVEAGTTTALVARFLLGKQDVRVISNSLLVVPYVRANALIRLTLLGGVFAPSTESLVGPTAVHDMEQFRVRYAFIGTDGFDIDAGCTTNIEEGAEILRTMCLCAQNTVLLADSSKYGKPGFVKTIPVSDVDLVITDDGLAAEDAEMLGAVGASVVRVPVTPGRDAVTRNEKEIRG